MTAAIRFLGQVLVVVSFAACFTALIYIASCIAGLLFILGGAL